MFDQFAFLTLLSLAILVLGIVLVLVKIRIGYLAIFVGIGGLFTMLLYYVLETTGLYGSEPHLAKNIIGVLILVIGGGLAAYYLLVVRRS